MSFLYDIVSIDWQAKTRSIRFYWHVLYGIVSSNSKNAPVYKLMSSLATDSGVVILDRVEAKTQVETIYRHRLAFSLWHRVIYFAGKDEV